MEGIEFEISNSCSSGLMHSLIERKEHEQKSFILAIEKGPLFRLLEEMIPNPVCLFHIGCSSDSRPPSFEYTLKYVNKRQEVLIFSYNRTIYPGIFFRNDFFHNSNGSRNLDAVARSLSNPGDYCEEISLICSMADEKNEDFGTSENIGVIFERNKFVGIRGLENRHHFRKVLIGFDDGLLDVENRLMKTNKAVRFNSISAKQWNKLFKKNGLTVNDFIREMYNLFQISAPKFGELKKPREALKIYQ